MHPLNSDSIGHLLVKQSLPTAAGLAVTSLYHLVNMACVGRGIGPSAIAAIAACFPYVLLQMGIAQCIGIGGASLISRQLGANNQSGARETVGTMLSLSLIAGLLLSLVTLACLDFILPLLAAQGPTLESAKSYLSIIAVGAPGTILMITGNNIARAQGCARRSMVSMFISSLSIMVLSPLLIFHFRLGIGGAALAVLIAQGGAALFICGCALHTNSPLRPSPKNLIPRQAVTKKIVSIGSSAFALQLAAFAVTLIVNHTLAATNPNAIAAYGILERLSNLALTALYALAYGVGPIVGFNSAQGRSDRVYRAITLSMVASIGIGTVIVVPFQLFPHSCAALFTTDPAIQALTIDALRTATLLFPLVGIHIVTTALFQALGHARTGFLLSIARPALFLIPLILLFAATNRHALFFAWPIADGMALMLTTTLLLMHARTLQKSKPPHTTLS